MVNVGIIGAGFMGTTHARAYTTMSNVVVKYIVDQSKEAGQKLADEIGSKAITDKKVVLDDPEIDLIDITLPTPFHPEMAISALEAGKHVVIEKPIALSLADARKMIETATKCNRLLMVAHVLRFQPEYAAIYKVIKSGDLGKPLLGHAYRMSNLPQWSLWFQDPEKTGGAVIDLQIHDIDFLNWIFGKPISVYARGRKDEYGGWNTLCSMIEYETGAASIECSFTKPLDYPFTCGIRLECEEGEVEYHFRSGGASFEQGNDSSYLLIHKPNKPNQPLVCTHEDGFVNELKYFIQCVEQNEAPKYLSAEDAYQALNTAIKIRESLEQGDKVSV